MNKADKEMSDRINEAEDKIGPHDKEKALLDEEIKSRAIYQVCKLGYKDHDKPYLKMINKWDNNTGASYEGPQCTKDGCVVHCRFFPDTGYTSHTRAGDLCFIYDDRSLDEQFLGTRESLKVREKIAAMTPEELEEYRHNDQQDRYYNQPEFTDEFKKILLNPNMDNPDPKDYRYKQIPQRFLDEYHRDRKAFLESEKERLKDLNM